ncbi:amino acid/amide ABC transporter substrate-binding protein (HAAT family) [Humitalea rosea]|uniref:Amino acid/amide ABC transporter substrate-binding protein (HAAT family) n=1 Tax=Humitalea rosea TaxID=990373 RepID=A0A2W7IJ25_9PROT|nr:amino acid ABC transporter substrate-binding protein [Humitalea rosea]PZW39347.1 amino acid/amide ABC transporter substrate-binding protein (HAAT family) [Humitalea rosea]
MTKITRRSLGQLTAATGLAAASGIRPAAAQAPSGPPLRIGYSMSLSGGLAGNGRPALATHRIWADDVNARGGLLGRPVELVHYDDQSNGAQVPGIYTKLIDVDKVDLVVSGYATAIIAPAMPIVMQRGMTIVTLLGTGVNHEFRYDRHFNICPVGSQVKETFAKGFFDIAMAMDPKPRTIAIAALDSDFPQRTAESARFLARQHGLRVVYDRSYPPGTVDFSPIMRSIQAARPDLVYIGSYPPDSVGLLRSASELRMSARMFGGAMIGPQISALKAQLGPILNNLVTWDVYAPEPTMQFPGVESLLRRYREVAAREQTDALGLYVPPLAYSQMQVLEQAVKRVGRIDQAALAADMHANAFDTVIGPLTFDALGEWTEERNLYVQYQGVTDGNLERFARPGTQVILYPPRYKSGELRGPYGASAT